MTEADAAKPAPANAAPIASVQKPASQPQHLTEPLPEIAGTQASGDAALASATLRQSLVQRALNQAAAADPSAIERSAQASYQQFLQSQQQPKATVHKRYQQLSRDPAGQVLAQLDDGKQLIRTKDGCRIADPAKDGFEGLMATRPVPCGDEVSRSALLQQALEKYSKR